jgi:hypothetical protein
MLNNKASARGSYLPRNMERKLWDINQVVDVHEEHSITNILQMSAGKIIIILEHQRCWMWQRARLDANRVGISCCLC